ncbi:Oligopeptide transport system permease protein OppC [Polystyrenella longa]|uniref:Oligopeptide transport system permease protein OppC n=1 Tax=Polystyrenella longa TaxID=2528007 RepID=A0A518CRZ7_9PLAN|nr:ABC transporter permease [Polystyrenella longa]QDU81995.1 Oligopeptide transport system permease protein OppC [Polystyrenella longa]
MSDQLLPENDKVTLTGSLDELETTVTVVKSPSFWNESWHRFKKRKLSMLALGFVGFLTIVALCSPMIVGTRPVVCKYKENIYFPCLYYFNASWENPIFFKDGFRQRFYENLKEKDPESWAVWPIVYQSPTRRITEGEFGNQPASPLLQEKPNKYHWFGTDDDGVDVFARLVHGTRIALVVGFLSMGIASFIGIVVGALGGYFGGWVDTILSRMTEVVMCVPTLVLILAMLAIVESTTIYHLMVVIGLTGWTGIARLTRAEFLKLKEMEFVSAAHCLSLSNMRIIFRHILPNSLAPILVPISFGIASAIFTESALSFLGMGAEPPTPSWGRLLSEAKKSDSQWWMLTFPGGAIFLAVLAYNLIGEGLQAATDPRRRD